jgi:hypothetical protein
MCKGQGTVEPSEGGKNIVGWSDWTGFSTSNTCNMRKCPGSLGFHNLDLSWSGVKIFSNLSADYPLPCWHCFGW